MNKFIISILGAMLALLALASCSKSETPLKPSDYFKREGLRPDFDMEQFKRNVAYLGGMSERDEAWIRARAGSKLVSDPSSAAIVIMGSSYLSTSEDFLNSSYNAGKILIVGLNSSTDLNKLRTLRDQYGWHFVLPEKIPSRDCAIGFCKDNSILISAPVRIKTEAKEPVVPQEIIEVTGERVYESTSVFYSARGLMTFINRATKHLFGKTKSSEACSSLTDKINTTYYDLPISMYWETCFCGRYLRVFNSANINYSVYPYYIPEEAGSSHGDYYSIKVTASNYAPTMYEYAKDGNPEDAVGSNPYAHYWAGEYSYWGDAQFRGPYNSQLKFDMQGKTASDLSFATGYRPLPTTDIDTRNYSNSTSLSWELGLSGGWSQESGFNIGFNAGIGGSKENTVEYSVSDIGVVNNSGNNTVNYEFNYQNLPSKDSTFDNYEDQMPTVCKSTADFQMSWEWTSTVNGDNSTIQIPTNTKVTQKLNIWARDKDAGVWHNYINSYEVHPEFDDIYGDILNVARVPIGCLRIENKCTDTQILYDITIKDETGATVFVSGNNIARDEYCEALLPQKDHSYMVYFNMGKSSTSTLPFYSNKAATLSLMIDPQNDKRVLYATENGGDFTTDTGLIRITNQSLAKLAFNIIVYKTSDNTAVYSYPSSIGYNVSADIPVAAGVEYYVTLDFGSRSSFNPYKSANNYTPASHKAESDVVNLYINNTGGDFILQ